jgi:hypothetical protein
VAARLWVRLGPLSPGRHEVAFGGRTTGGFESDITYELTVR